MLSPVPNALAGILVFLTSAAVLVLEILAGRLLAPYVGTGLETYTGIIGTVLAGIALGTWAGGRLADAVDPRRLIGPLVAGGGALALMTVPTVRFFGGATTRPGADTIVFLTCMGFFAPAVVLSAVSPTVVKLQLRDLDRAGTVVGRLSALGTAGGLFGTFVTGFVLVAAFPVPAIVVGVGLVLVAAGVALWVWLARPAVATVAPVVAVGLFGGGLSVALTDPCEVVSRYSCARVEVDATTDGGRLLRIDSLRHSYVDLDDPTHLEFWYARAVAGAVDAVAGADRPLEALHVGGGGFTIPRWIEATHPGSRSLVLELDPAVVQLARDELGLRTGADLQVRTGDARLGLGDLADASYDVVVGDAFGGLAVPWHLTTREFAAELERVLRPDGVYAVNVIDHPPLSLARAEAATLREVFGHVAVIAPPGGLAGLEGGNLVLVASSAPLDAAVLQRAARAEGAAGAEVAAGADADRFIGGADVLTDDMAPVDQLLTPRR
jgi:spermidine synthase